MAHRALVVAVPLRVTSTPRSARPLSLSGEEARVSGRGTRNYRSISKSIRSSIRLHRPQFREQPPGDNN
jgi:hypothetical protein